MARISSSNWGTVARGMVSFVSILILLAACAPKAGMPVPAAQTVTLPAASITPAATPTAVPSATPTQATGLSLTALQNYSYCQIAVGCAGLKDGKFSNDTGTGSMLDLHASGDLNGDGQTDAVVLIDETYGGTHAIDLVAVLNQGGKPGNTISYNLGSSIKTVDSLAVEDGQVVVTTAEEPQPQTPQAPVSRTLRLALTGLEVGGNLRLFEQRMSTRDSSGAAFDLTLDPPEEPLTAETYLVKGRLASPPEGAPEGGKLAYTIYDERDIEVYSGESAIQAGAAGAFSLPVDLGWVQAGKLHIRVSEFYSTPTVRFDQAFDSQWVDFQPQARQARPPLFASFVQMRDAQEGWAQLALPASGALAHTTDGGRTWRKVSLGGKAGLKLLGGVRLYWLDAKTGWAVVSANEDLGPTTPAGFYRTLDGGQTWQELPDLPTSFATPHFMDINHGILETTAGLSFMMGQNRYRLYQTADGGQHWNKVFDNTPDGAQVDVDPTRGQMVFRDLQNGWNFDPILGMTVNYMLYLMRTRDGGHTWKDAAESLPFPDVPQDTFLSQRDLRFFGAKRAVMPLLISPVSGTGCSLRLYHSENGGGTWTLSDALALDACGQPGIDIFDPDQVVVTETNSIHLTLDGGQTWTTTPYRPALPDIAGAPFFVSPQVGFALANDHNPAATSTDLFRTDDGGKTWQKLDVKVEN